MNLITILILISSLSFLGYGIAYFISPQMKSEFKRFGLEKVGTLTAVLELLGAVGLLVGLKIHLILLISAGGLALLMFLGVAVRVKNKDSLWISLPATSNVDKAILEEPTMVRIKSLKPYCLNSLTTLSKRNIQTYAIDKATITCAMIE